MTRDKTNTIKQRAIYVYLPSIELTEKWKEIAKKRRQSISGFVVETIENAMSVEEEDSIESRSELIKKNKELNEQVREMRKDLHRFKILVDRQEKELRDFRAQPFLDEDFQGVRTIPKETIDLLKKRGRVRYEELHNLLDIDPGSDASAALQVQLNVLENYGLIEYTGRFVRWKE